MNIQAIKPYNTAQYRTFSRVAAQNNNTSTPNTHPNNIYPCYAKINFRGRSMEKLWDEYNWYINHDKTPAVFSFLKIKEAPEVMEKFLYTILEAGDRSKEFFSSIVYNPRAARAISDGMRHVLPSNSQVFMPFLFSSPYNKAYSKFTVDKVNEAHSLEDLLRIRPDWRGDLLLKKFADLRGTDKLTIGNVPKELPFEHLREIVKYLSTQMEFGVKPQKNIESLTLDGRRYDFKYFTEGKSDKNVFGLFTPEGKKFVLKMSKPESRSLDAPFALGTLAKIDSYLTYNRSRNSAPLCYYNHEDNFSIYKYIEHVSVEDSTNDLNIIAKNMPDFGSLGLSYNDTVGFKNFFRLSPESNADLVRAEGFQEGINKGEWISVDNDHVTYSNYWQPGLSGYHASLPNAMQMFF